MLGGTKFTGPYTAAGLLERGHEVTVFHRGKSNNNIPPGVRHIHGDRQNLAEFAGTFRDLAPDVVVDMICFTEEDAQMLMQTFSGVASRVVVPSSEDVYRAYGRLHGTEPGPLEPMPLTEDSPLREKLSIHGKAYEKISVERIVMGDSSLPGTVLRFPAIYGPHDPAHRLHHYLERMGDDRPVILLESQFSEWKWTRGYAENVALATTLAVIHEKAAGRIYNVGEAEAKSETEWIRSIGEVMGWHGDIVGVDRDTLTLPDEQRPAGLRAHSQYSTEEQNLVQDFRQHWVIDSSRIRRELGYEELISFREGLERTIEWELAHPPENAEPEEDTYAAEDAVLAELAERGG
jgi:nucleoside-diphosphate-sugar epimerase